MRFGHEAARLGIHECSDSGISAAARAIESAGYGGTENGISGSVARCAVAVFPELDCFGTCGQDRVSGRCVGIVASAERQRTDYQEPWREDGIHEWKRCEQPEGHRCQYVGYL